MALCKQSQKYLWDCLRNTIWRLFWFSLWGLCHYVLWHFAHHVKAQDRNDIFLRHLSPLKFVAIVKFKLNNIGTFWKKSIFIPCKCQPLPTRISGMCFESWWQLPPYQLPLAKSVGASNCIYFVWLWNFKKQFKKASFLESREKRNSPPFDVFKMPSRTEA